MDRRKQALELQKQGVKLKDIASKIGITPRTLQNWGIKKKGNTGYVKVDDRKIKKVDKKIIESVMQNDELTEKRKLFCLYWINNRNATQSYLKAYGGGYDVANVEGPRLLVVPCVRDEVNRLREIKAQSIMVGEKDIVERYMRIAFADMTDFMEFGSVEVPIITEYGPALDSEGNMLTKKENRITFKESKVVDGGLICEISQNRQGTKIKLEDRQKALNFLAKYFEMNPNHRHQKEHNDKKLELEKARFELYKKIEENKKW